MYYVGIDVSKRHHDATVIDATGQVVIAPFRFFNTRQGVTTLLTRLQTLDAQVRIARRAVWMASSVARRYDPDLKALYQRKRLQRKYHNVVMGAVCHRLLARIYVILKEQRPYEVRNPATKGSSARQLLKLAPPG